MLNQKIEDNESSRACAYGMYAFGAAAIFIVAPVALIASIVMEPKEKPARPDMPSIKRANSKSPIVTQIQP